MSAIEAKNRSHLGVGLYTLADASRIAGAPRATIHRWLSEKRGIVPRYFEADEKLLTFEELMELHFIQMFRAEGVSFQTIRRASETASQLFNTNYPFTVKRFDTDGRTVFATLKENNKKLRTEDLEHGQFVFRSIVKPFFRKLEYKGTDEKVIRFWPREKRGRVVLDPTRKFGKPIDSASGISTSAIYDAVKAGGGQKPALVARWLNIPVASVKAAVEFEQSLAT